MKGFDGKKYQIGIKIIGFVGIYYPKKSITIIQNGLKDPEWNVKNAATDAFKKIGKDITSISIIDNDSLNNFKKILNNLIVKKQI